ncbi:MAG TPA: hypothetical protein VGG61_16585 [Gemmataceae bacterium]|jgi:hypothetical protein
MNPPIAVLDDLFAGRIAAVCREPDGAWNAAAARPVGLLAGAFNPLHEGHRRLAEVAAGLLGGPVAFELSVLNVDKPSLTDVELCRRLGQFADCSPLWLTRAPTFEAKARLFPHTTFVVGADTAARIVAARYYGESEKAMHAALDAIARQSCRFLVAGRADQDGRFVELEHLAIPVEFAGLFQGITRSFFEADISSTRLRELGEPGA